MKKSTLIASMTLGFACMFTAGSAMAQISLEQAKQIVLQHAGVNANEAGFIQIKQDMDDGINEYEIEFWKGNTEYEYSVNADNGQILSHKQEIKQNAVNIPQVQQMPNQQALIGNQKAVEIALNHAKVSQDQTRRLNCYQEFDDGRAVYKVEFWKEYTEYDYEIDAVTGTVIEFDAEHN